MTASPAIDASGRFGMFDDPPARRSGWSRPGRERPGDGAHLEAPDRPPAPEPPEAERRADEEGLRSAFANHGGALLGLAARSLGDVQSGEEAVQETFVRAWRARHRFDPTLGTLRGWLFAIERRVVIDMARARARRPSLAMAAVEEVGEATPDSTEAVVTSLQVQDALGHLAPAHREVLEAVYFGGLSGTEAATALGIPEGTVRSRLHYALRAMRTTLGEAGWTG